MNLDQNLAKKVDEARIRYGYLSRQEFIRDCIRRFLEERERYEEEVPV